MTILFVLSSQKTLADIPANLKPGDPNAYWCTDKPGAKDIVVTYRENKDAHAQIKDGHIDWGAVVLAAAVALLGGYELGAATR